ncbi:alpha/beta hydrolase [Paracoccaceae bacterium]|nr:alpha/beta hydrolase [Paracoccaceae bacterium]
MPNTDYYNTKYGQKLAFSQVTDNKKEKKLPGVVFLSGLKSDKEGTKAVYLHHWAESNNRDFLRFDYSGHGGSSKDFEATSISDWLKDTESIISGLTNGPQIIVGSSLGGWIALLLAKKYPELVCGIVGIAAAPDFTAQYRNENLSRQQRHELSETGKLSFSSEYFEDPLNITKRLIDDGNMHLVLETNQKVNCPVRLLHGSLDVDVPLSTSLEIIQRINSDDITLNIVKGIDHRFSKPKCLLMITKAVEEISILISEPKL